MADEPRCTYTMHAREQMGRRGIDQGAVEYVLSHYDTRHPATPRVGVKPAEILSGIVEGRRLRVYIEIGSDPPRVKTAAWTD